MHRTLKYGSISEIHLEYVIEISSLSFSSHARTVEVQTDTAKPLTVISDLNILGLIFSCIFMLLGYFCAIHSEKSLFESRNLKLNLQSQNLLLS